MNPTGKALFDTNRIAAAYANAPRGSSADRVARIRWIARQQNGKNSGPDAAFVHIAGATRRTDPTAFAQAVEPAATALAQTEEPKARASQRSDTKRSHMQRMIDALEKGLRQLITCDPALQVRARDVWATAGDPPAPDEFLPTRTDASEPFHTPELGKSLNEGAKLLGFKSFVELAMFRERLKSLPDNGKTLVDGPVDEFFQTLTSPETPKN